MEPVVNESQKIGKKKEKLGHSILNKLNMLNNKFIFSITTLMRFLNLKQKYKENQTAWKLRERSEVVSGTLCICVILDWDWDLVKYKPTV